MYRAKPSRSKIPVAMINLVEFSVVFRILMGPNRKYFGQRFHRVGKSVVTILLLVVSFCRCWRNAVSEPAHFLICLSYINKDGARSGSFLELERARDLRGLRLRGSAVVGCILSSRING